MAYKRQDFEDEKTLFAEQLNHIEDGIVEVNNKLPYKHRTAFQVSIPEPIFGSTKEFEAVPQSAKPTKQKMYLDNCVLYLPVSYQPTGTPTKLVIYCKHGSTEIKQASDVVLNEQVTKLFLKQGYAILGCDGMPEQWRADRGLTPRITGSPTGVTSVKAAYNHVVDKYNIDTNGVFVYGHSQGGHYALHVAQYSGLPICAVALDCPIVSMRYHTWDVPSTSSWNGFTKLSRLNVARIFGYPAVTTNAELEALEYNPEYTKGWDAFVRNTDEPFTGFVKNSNDLWYLPDGFDMNTVTSKTYVDYPIKIWAGAADSTLSTDVMKVFIKSIRNAGGKADIKIFTGGNHGLTNLPTLETTSYQYKTDAGADSSLSISVRTSGYEMLQFFAEFGGNKPYEISTLSGQTYPE